LGATLSLPGIAGMVLTIGMAIDASILIYEGIKEDLAAGITPRKSVEKGFSDAMVVILDSNITTFLMGLVLYKFGTGPIQGFAVTMMVGIISTLLTGLFFLRAIFNYYLINLGVQKLSI
jgi:protein-export membrane protein SecD